MIVINCEQGSELWYAERAGRITGTRFKELMSGVATKGYNDLIYNVACEIISGRIEETYKNEWMERGKELEQEAREEYKEITGYDVQEVGFVVPDDENDWIGCSPDGIVNGVGLLEIKCPMAKTHFGYIESGTLPTEYRYQVQGQLFVSQLEWCDFMSYYPNMKPFIIRVFPDLELFVEFEERLSKFIDQVQSKISKYRMFETEEI